MVMLSSFSLGITSRLWSQARRMVWRRVMSSISPYSSSMVTVSPMRKGR